MGNLWSLETEASPLLATIPPKWVAAVTVWAGRIKYTPRNQDMT